MKNLINCLKILTVFILFFSCKKSTPADPIPDPVVPVVTDAAFAQNFGNSITRDFIIQIVDITNNPIPAVAVKLAGNTKQTDANGIVVIKNASVFDKFAYVTAQKTGFIFGSKAVVPTSGENSIKIIMLSNAVTATINSGVTSNVNLPNGTKVTFDGNFKTDAGVTYSGSVKVSLNHLDPADPDMAKKTPGMLFAKSSNGDAKILETYGMVNVELTGAAGEKLQIKNPAQVEFPITATQQSIAPATIPLWHFDENVGYWKEDGVATKSGNKYIGSVSHFSWWNVDMPFNGIQLTIKVVDQNNNPLPNVKTVLTNSYPANTGSNGEVSGMVRANIAFNLNIYANNSCNTLLATQNIGPFATNTILPNIVINTSAIPAIQVKNVNGNLKKCNNTNVTNGYVTLTYDGNSYLSASSNGNFSFNLLQCSSVNTFTILGEDLDNLQNTGMIAGTFTALPLNLGTLTTCQTIPESITYTIDNGAMKTATSNLSATVAGSSFTINGGNSGMQNQISINGNSIVPGTYTTGFTLSGNGLNTAINQPLVNFNITYTVVSVGAVGQYINVNFTGTYVEMIMTGMGTGYNANHTITGTAHVLRTL